MELFLSILGSIIFVILMILIIKNYKKIQKTITPLEDEEESKSKRLLDVKKDEIPQVEDSKNWEEFKNKYIGNYHDETIINAGDTIGISGNNTIYASNSPNDIYLHPEDTLKENTPKKKKLISKNTSTDTKKNKTAIKIKSSKNKVTKQVNSTKKKTKVKK